MHIIRKDPVKRDNHSSSASQLFSIACAAFDWILRVGIRFFRTKAFDSSKLPHAFSAMHSNQGRNNLPPLRKLFRIVNGYCAMQDVYPALL